MKRIKSIPTAKMLGFIYLPKFDKSIKSYLTYEYDSSTISHDLSLTSELIDPWA